MCDSAYSHYSHYLLAPPPFQVAFSSSEFSGMLVSLFHLPTRTDLFATPVDTFLYLI